MAILDTTFLVALQRGEQAALDLLSEFRQFGAPLRVPAAVWVEYLSGFPPGSRSRVTQELTNSCVFEPFDRAQADAAARLQHELAKGGLPLSWHDLQIAATAFVAGEPLLTSDEGFQRVVGLDVRLH